MSGVAPPRKFPMAGPSVQRYALAMKSIGALAVVWGVVLCGCAKSGQADRAAAEFLGPGAVHVLERPTKVEGWNFQRPDGSIASEPPIRPLDLAVARELRAVVLDEDAYRTPARGGAFERAVGFRVWRGDQSVDVLLSLANDQMLLKYLAYNGQPTSSLAGVGAARDRLIKVARAAFPEYRPPTK